tara:strand:+ start:1216 stop:1872 length:657 start_codon:yes stop_codon:yes gene_type:complete
MPAKSAKQLKLMQAVANSPKFAKKVGVPQSVGEEYSKENKMYNKKMMNGGKVKKMMNGGMAMADKTGTRAMDPRMAMAMEAQRRQAAMGGMKEGGKVEGPAKSAKYAAMKGAAFGSPEVRKKLKEEIITAAKKVKSKLGMKKGGKVKRNTSKMNSLEELGRVDAEKAYTKKGKRNLKSEKKRVVSEVKRGYKKGGMVSSASKRADGIITKGRTRGRMV